MVLEAGGAGGGSTGVYGEPVESALAESATVLTYDRVGSGRSDGPQRARVSELADDLAAVIRAMDCATPVVLVGWSSGGLVAEMFAVRHPDLLAALVLIDPSVGLPGTWIRQRIRLALGAAQVRLFSVASRCGLFRTRLGASMIRRMAGPDASPAGLDYAFRMCNDWLALRQASTTLGRLARYADETAEVLRAASLPDVPVRVIIPEERGGFSAADAAFLNAAHGELMEVFPNAKLVTAADASHAVPLDRPDVVIATVRELLSA